MTIEQLLDSFDDLMDEAFTLPFSTKKVIDAAGAREIIDDLRLNIPQEVRQAKAIVSDKNDIIGKAKAEAERIIRDAETKAKQLVSREEILKQAKAQSDEIIENAHLKSRDIKKAAAEYAESALKNADDILQQTMLAQREIYRKIEEQLSLAVTGNKEISKRSDELMVQNINTLRKTRQGLRSAGK